jgi:dCTP deaminase
MLSGKEIKKRLNKDIIIEPFDEKQINPNSYNVLLSNELYIYEDEVLDIKKAPNLKKIIIPDDGYVLEPGKLYIGHTVEYTETYNLVPMIDGRSSLGRLGLFTNSSAGFGDVGFKGTWSLQLTCIHPVKIYPNMKIAQLYYEEIIGEIENYHGKYLNPNNKNNNLTSMIYKEYEK